jgi:iron(III) transport system substrate-binding protein
LLLSGVLALAACTSAPATSPSQPPASAESSEAAGASASPSLDELTLDELAELAKAEGGTLNWAATLNERDTALMKEGFAARFPGFELTHVHAGTEDLVARAIAEANGGRVLVDAFQLNPAGTATLNEAGLLVDDWLPPEVADWPDELKSPYSYSTYLNGYIIAWNTDLVPDAEAPKTYEELTDPKYKGKLISDAEDVRLLVAMARHKYKDDAKAREWLEGVAANDVQFHSGASNMRALLESGQAAICFSCLAHHYPPIMAQGAPVNFSLEESVVDPSQAAVSKGAPHPLTAMLFTRWLAADDGGQAILSVNANPASPNVEPQAPIRPKTRYVLEPADLEQWDHYTEIWNEVFGLRG